MARSTVITIWSDGGRQCFTLESGSYTIGRDPSCDLVVSSMYLQPRHARLRLMEGTFAIEDLSGGDEPVTVAGKALQIPGRAQFGEFSIEVGETSASGFDADTGTISPMAAEVGETFLEEAAGTVIGPYTLLEQIGEGGFGRVWRARQEVPVRREVALKILKPGMDSREVLARFEQERQALARMSHPGIASVFDAGLNATGRPYFVMEDVRGLPITAFASGKGWKVRERLQHFVEVCRAVHHAHQKGIIHRDLKPSNILVSELDGGSRAKVIDFGIAKVTAGVKLSEFSVVTRQNQLVGTPAYMSPEQTLGTSGDIDTRTDIYGLGVMLYELLTGETPFGGEVSTSQIGLNWFTLIQTKVPERPSSRIRSRRKADASVALPADPEGLLRGDLDWVVMKCLEKEPGRRYASAAALADDLEALLECRPVQARPPSVSYQARRFAQRNRAVVVGVAAVLIAILAGLGVSTALYFRERDALRQADVQLKRSQQVARFLKDTLGAVDPTIAMGRDTTLLRDILDQTSKRLDSELAGEPEIQAELGQLIGNVYNDLRYPESSVAHLEKAMRLQREIDPNPRPELAACILDYAAALEVAGRVKECEPYAVEALEMWRTVAGVDSSEAVSAETLVAWAHILTGREREAEPMALHALEIWRQRPGEPALSEAPNTLATLYSHTGRAELAAKVYSEELQMLRKVHGGEHPFICTCLDNLGVELLSLGRRDEAEPLLLEGVAMGRKFFGDRNPDEDHMLSALASIAGARGDLDEQMRYIREARDAGARIYPKGHRYWREAHGKYVRTSLTVLERYLDRAWLNPADPDALEQLLAKAPPLLEELATDPDLAAWVKPETAWLDCLDAGVQLARARAEGDGVGAAESRFGQAAGKVTQLAASGGAWKARSAKLARYRERMDAVEGHLTRAESNGDVPRTAKPFTSYGGQPD